MCVGGRCKPVKACFYFFFLHHYDQNTIISLYDSEITDAAAKQQFTVLFVTYQGEKSSEMRVRLSSKATCNIMKKGSIMIFSIFEYWICWISTYRQTVWPGEMCFTRGDVLLFEAEKPSEDLQTFVTVAPPDATCAGKHRTTQDVSEADQKQRSQDRGMGW